MLRIEQRHLPAAQYVGPASRAKRDMILLHFTGGMSVESAVSSWLSTKERVATRFVMQLNGVVADIMPASSWAFHIGLDGARWKNGIHDERSVGVEIVNPGPLKLNGENLMWWPDDFKTVYCKFRERDKYIQTKTWRGFEYWARFTPAQYEALPLLMDRIMVEYPDIPRVFLPSATRLEYVEPLTMDAFKGISTHSNWRTDKLDIGPAFDWRCIGG